MRRLIVHPGQLLKGSVAAPPSKYHEHRALLMAALADGPSTINGRSGCRHVEFTVRALRALGTRIDRFADGYLVTPRPWATPPRPVSAGSSGTTLYLLLGLLHRCVGGEVTLTGTRSLRHRPIAPLLEALTQAGIAVAGGPASVPVRVRPGPFRGGQVRVSGFLSQWTSGLLLAAPFARDGLRLRVVPPRNEVPYVALTVDLLRRFGIQLEAAHHDGWYAVQPGQRFDAATIDLPADYSSVAFLLAAAALLPHSDVTIDGDFSADHPEHGVLALLQQMSADITLAPDRRSVRVRGGAPLNGIRVDCRDTPDLLPILAVVATQARGRTVFDHVTHVRRKESDRVRAMAQLSAMGARIEESPDRLIVRGRTALRGAHVSTWNDHRVQMAFAVAGLVAGGVTSMPYPFASRLSYPTFFDDMRQLGADFQVVGA
jgi:3-phosphoshikimate 1-carboxyvinyltransferase